MVEGPAAISFSGGRTSALMLRRLLDEGLAPDVHVLFANTGKEREETLVFVRECAERWSVPVVWLERPAGGGHRVVNFNTAARNGEPFLNLISERGFLPNPMTRFCTQELKVRVMKRWMMAQGYDHWTNIVGLRADEPGRVARIRASEGKERWDISVPLYDAGITRADVEAFWRCQPFDLGLRPWEGNCDLCFLKGKAKRIRIMRDRPELAQWWIDREDEAAATVWKDRPDFAKFRTDVPDYRRLKLLSEVPMLPFDPDDIDGLDDLGDCVCSEGS